MQIDVAIEDGDVVKLKGGPFRHVMVFRGGTLDGTGGVLIEKLTLLPGSNAIHAELKKQPDAQIEAYVAGLCVARNMSKELNAS